MSNSVRPHRWQPTRLPHPWDSPGKNTGVGCHCLLQCMKLKSESEAAQSCPTPIYPMDCSLPGSSVHGIFQARVLEWGAIAFSSLPPRFCLLQILYFQQWPASWASDVCISTCQLDRPMGHLPGPSHSKYSECSWIWPLYIDTKLNLRDRILCKVEKNSFIALSGRGGHSWLVVVWLLSCIWLLLLLLACWAPQSMEFSRQEYWSGFPFPPPEDLPDPGIKPRSPALQADSSMPSKLCPNLEGVVRSSIVMFQRGHDQLVDIILTGWWWGKWKSGSPTILLVWGLPSCGQHTVNFSHLEGVSVSTKQLRDCYCIPWGTAPRLLYSFFWLLLSILHIPSLS